MVITADSLTILRNGQRLLSDLSFSLSSQSILILRGPNGVGKTSLLRVLAGISLPSSGYLCVNPDDLVYAGHLDGIKSALTLYENLSFWADIYGYPRDRIDIVLEGFELAKFSNHLVQHLSAGQKRCLGLARVVLSNRKLWILDEPTVSMDVIHIASFHECLLTHVRSGGSAVLSTHLPFFADCIQELDMCVYRAIQGELDLEDPFLESLF